MAAAELPLLARKRAEKRPPRRVGGVPRRIGPPTRHGCGRAPSFSWEKGKKTPATSHWNSNTTWLRQDTLFWLGKGRKIARHVVLEECHVALGFQRAMAAAGNSLLAWKRVKRRPPRRVGSEPRRIGSPTRHGCGRAPSFSSKKGGEMPATSCWESATSYWPSNATWLSQRHLVSYEPVHR